MSLDAITRRLRRFWSDPEALFRTAMVLAALAFVLKVLAACLPG